jgi:hypothetical protein
MRMKSAKPLAVQVKRPQTAATFAESPDNPPRSMFLLEIAGNFSSVLAA